MRSVIETSNPSNGPSHLQSLLHSFVSQWVWMCTNLLFMLTTSEVDSAPVRKLPVLLFPLPVAVFPLPVMLLPPVADDLWRKRKSKHSKIRCNISVDFGQDHKPNEEGRAIWIKNLTSTTVASLPPPESPTCAALPPPGFPTLVLLPPPGSPSFASLPPPGFSTFCLLPPPGVPTFVSLPPPGSPTFASLPPPGSPTFP